MSLSRADGIEVASRSGYARVDPERTLAVAAPLLDCRVDAYELRAVLQGTALGIFHLGASFAMVLSATGCAWIASHYGWRWAFYVVVLPGIFLGLWSFFMREPGRGGTELSAPGNNRSSEFRYIITSSAPPLLREKPRAMASA